MGWGSGIFCSYFGVPNITYVTTSGETRENYFNENCYYRKLSNAEIYDVIDLGLSGNGELHDCFGKLFLDCDDKMDQNEDLANLRADTSIEKQEMANENRLTLARMKPKPNGRN